MAKKEDVYKDLVDERKGCKDCDSDGLVNPAREDLKSYDSNEIGMWSLWHGDLNAKIMIIGQDWGDVDYFNGIERRGRSIRMHEKGRDSDDNPTCKNLIDLLSIIIGHRIEPPSKSINTKKKEGLFFTNAILCLKLEKDKEKKNRNAGMQGSVEDKWFDNCRYFLKKQIRIVEPEIIIALSAKVFESVLRISDKTFKISKPYHEIVRSEKWITDLSYKLIDNEVKHAKVFPVFHCGSFCNINRPEPEMKADWTFINDWINEHMPEIKKEYNLR